ncbi:MAG TPA: LytTR family DNA-binding domain-containing protein [Flavobacteriales bacterium]|nr:LytTR family DNA-binding domain-containing protein [Flavobacteriales bacterium]HRP81616.1 LytTR family DNA-binding domain-containing protein [Flavobacteriales bacterium]
MDLKLRLLIVDDEAPARAALREALANCGVPHEIVGQADGREAAVRLMDRMRPDVLLLDIRLGDGTGFEVLDQAAWKKARVIFITAYDQYAIRAFRCAAVDYLLKPVDPALLAQALERALPDSDPAQMETLLRNLATPGEERVVVPCAEGIHVLDPRNLLRCEADSNYTHLFTHDGERIVTARTLKDFEDLLAPHRFERVHMSHLVNLLHVRKFLNRDGGTLVLTDGSTVPVSQRKRQVVIDALAKL